MLGGEQVTRGWGGRSLRAGCRGGGEGKGEGREEGKGCDVEGWGERWVRGVMGRGVVRGWLGKEW